MTPDAIPPLTVMEADWLIAVTPVAMPAQLDVVKFVAVDRTGNAVKLVDRLGFSRRNLTALKKFGK